MESVGAEVEVVGYEAVGDEWSKGDGEKGR